MTEPEPLLQVDRTYVRSGGRKLSYFAGCDYFRLASHPKVLLAAQRGVSIFGLNVAASRMTTGNHGLYKLLEGSLASFFQAPAALIVSNGYLTNTIAAQALRGRFSHALIDERAHASLTDATLFLDCPIVRFKHRDPQDVAAALKRCGRGIKPLLLTDGMFSHDGSIAPLKDYLKVLPRDGMILLDDAHGAGTLGRHGRGTPELTRVPRTQIVQTITLSKAFGVYGGAILCSAALRQKIMRDSRAFIGHTPLALPLANAVISSLLLLKMEPGLRRRLEANVTYAKSFLRKRGFPVVDSPAPIIPFIPKDGKQAEALKKRLLAREIFPSFIRYLGGPKDGYFRFVLSSEHSREQLDALLEVLAEAGEPASRPER